MSTVFIAGATGVIGRRLVPLLLQRGHAVVGMTRTPTGRERLERLGARAVIADALDPDAVGRAISEAAPDVVMHQLTALSDLRDFRNFDRAFADNARLRSEGTDILLSASRAAGVHTFIAQSFAGFLLSRSARPVLAEDDALDPEPPRSFQRAFRADRHLEDAVTKAAWTRGIVLRYGGFYGPGTSLSKTPPGSQTELVRQRKFPVVGGGRAVWSFIHIDDAAAATVAALEHGRRGIYHITDDEPAAVAEWLPFLARVLGAKPPWHVPRWLGRVLAGPSAVVMMTETHGASNRKARAELGWTPEYPTWREGFTHGLG